MTLFVVARSAEGGAPDPPPVHMTPPVYGGAPHAQPVHPHHAPPHPGPYSPSPAPHYPTPPPVYGYSPAPAHYAPAPQVHKYGYSPAPPPAHHAPVYGYGHQPSPTPYPAPPPAPQPVKPHYDGPPACSKNTTKSWCLEDAEYPAYEISHAIEYNYAGVASLYKVKLLSSSSLQIVLFSGRVS